MKRINKKSVFISNVLLFLVIVAFVGGIIWRFGDHFGLKGDENNFFAWLICIMTLIFVWASWYFSRLYRLRKEQHHSEKERLRPEKEARIEYGKVITLNIELAEYLCALYGPFWRRKIRLLLVTGEPEQAEAIAPGLTGQHWLEGDHTVLIYGGRPSAEPDVTLLIALKKLRRSRPLDGIIWPLTEEQSRQTAQLDKGWRELINGGKRLGFQAPLYLWQVCDDGDYQSGRIPQSVGCLLPERCTPEQLASMLEAQTLPLTEQGMSQLLADNRHDFLLRLAHTLAERGIAHWQTVLKPLLAGGAFSSLRLRGLMFSPPLAAVPESAPHAWLPSPVWAGVTGDNARGRTVGFPWLRASLITGICMLAIWGAGMTTSFFANRTLVQETSIQTARALDTRLPLSEQLVALHTLQGELERLQYRIREGALWYQRFALNVTSNCSPPLFPAMRRRQTGWCATWPLTICNSN